ncbi:LacI family DNA-binding transcriptional regulator [Mucilaginibacter gossypiicola]|uniref:LacI family DNA-binding transcriptional regulator n=1 Tax=Mucilaginibacter gossypiicola TaxID=551995 RepID=UPI001FCB6A3A|nr:LacI family DNA-binding transcriptional regulator [Mucilaginibacter gossypiicola]
MHDNEKEITIYDIAEKLNVSAATVSRALKDHPRVKKILKRRSLRLPKKWDIVPIRLPVIYVEKTAIS